MVTYQAAVPAVAVDCRPRQPDTRRGNRNCAQVRRTSPRRFAISCYCFSFDNIRKKKTVFLFISILSVGFEKSRLPTGSDGGPLPALVSAYFF
jgi:hypothetical protein